MSREGLTRYQRRQIRELEARGWNFVEIRRIGDEFATVIMRDPEGEEHGTGVPRSKTVERHYLQGVGRWPG